jgi:hypothetical protein
MIVLVEVVRAEEAGSSEEVGSSGKVGLSEKAALMRRDRCHQGEFLILTIKAGTQSRHQAVCHQSMCHQAVCSQGGFGILPSRRVSSMWVLGRAVKAGAGS